MAKHYAVLYVKLFIVISFTKITYSRNDLHVLKNGDPNFQISKTLAGCTSDQDELLTTTGDCELKVKVLLNISNIKETLKIGYVIIIDEVFDEVSNQNVRLVYPIVLKIKQDHAVKWYDLNLWHIVNGNVWEEVINKKQKNFTACDDSTLQPTCGMLVRDSGPVPFSQGFCCSCNSWLNEENESKILAWNKFDYLNTQVYRKHKRYVTKDGRQVRGGQDCNDLNTPVNANQTTYHESAHCLRLSDIWYAVYTLNKPKFFHNTYVQVFQKSISQNKSSLWKDFMNGHMLNLGSSLELQVDKQKKFAFMYASRKDKAGDPVEIGYESNLLLVPLPRSHNSIKKNKPGECLLIKHSLISSNSNYCNKAGTGFEAFYHQVQRCNASKGTCLQNQPIHFWLRDTETRQRGDEGQYFIESYAKLSNKPFRMETKRNGQGIAFVFNGSYFPSISGEIKLISNSLAKINNFRGELPEVRVDSTSNSKTIMTVYFINMDLISYSVSLEVVDCPKELSSALLNVTIQTMEALPHRKTMFKIIMDGALPIERFHCSLYAKDQARGIIAKRYVVIHRLDRCYCLNYCQCTCFDFLKSTHCDSLTVEQYKAAGFSDDLPSFAKRSQVTIGQKLVHLFIEIVLFIMLLLLFGFLKCILGFFVWRRIKLCGLRFILPPREIKRYYEKDLKNEEVVYDHKGYPVHPETGYPVMHASKIIYTLLNISFFIVFPAVALCKILRKLLNFIFKCCRRVDKSLLPTYSDKSAIEDDSVNLDDGMREDITEKTKLLDEKHAEKQYKKKHKESLRDLEAENIETLYLDESFSEKSSETNDMTFLTERSYLVAQKPTRLKEFNYNTERPEIPIQESETDEKFFVDTSRSPEIMRMIKSDTGMISKHSNEIAKISVGSDEIQDIMKVRRISAKSLSEFHIKQAKLLESSGLSETESDDQTPASVIFTVRDIDVASDNNLEISSSDKQSGHKERDDNKILKEIKEIIDNIQLEEEEDVVLSLQKGYQQAFVPTRAPEEESVYESAELTSDSYSAEIIGTNDYVDRLLKSKSVYRNLVHPIADISFPEGEKYSLKGYLNKATEGYKFIPIHPARQYWTKGDKMYEKRLPPLELQDDLLERIYNDEKGVLEEVSIRPKGITINVQKYYFSQACLNGHP